MEENVFSFKHFKVRHGLSSMKVGVDAVLLGAWAGENATKILDVGTGCGIIALIMAQRFPTAFVEGIDIDNDSVIEASINFENSLWRDRLRVYKKNFTDIDFAEIEKKYDLIVSNPPYFSSGVINPETPRERARHQDSLSVFHLIDGAGKLLSEDGKLSMIFPIEFYDDVIIKMKENSFCLYRECFIRDREKSREKRVMIEIGRSQVEVDVETLILFDEARFPTKKYQELCRDLYLKF